MFLVPSGITCWMLIGWTPNITLTSCFKLYLFGNRYFPFLLHLKYSSPSLQKQWAAVITHFLLRRLPPQIKFLTSFPNTMYIKNGAGCLRSSPPAKKILEITWIGLLSEYQLFLTHNLAISYKLFYFLYLLHKSNQNYQIKQDVHSLRVIEALKTLEFFSTLQYVCPI